MVDMKTFMVKGAPMIADLEYISKNHGQEGLDKVFAAMSPEDADVYQHRLLAGTWYTMEFRVALLKAIDKVFAHGRPDYFWALGAHQAEHNITKIYRTFSRVGGDKGTAKMAKVFWGLIYKSSHVETRADKGLFELEVFEYPKIGTFNCHVVRGYIHRAMELTGSKKENVRSTEPVCLNRGGDHCKFVVKWK